MFVVTGITGKVGGVVADVLLEHGLSVRAVVRDAEKGAKWREKGCEISIVPDASNGEALHEAFSHSSGVFLMNPPEYDPAPGFPKVQQTVRAVTAALNRTRPGKVVFLSTIGAHVSKFNLLNNAGFYERALAELQLPVAFLRPAWFMENASWDVADARTGLIKSYLQPLDRGINMVATRDIGATAAQLLQENWTGVKVVELSGPELVSPNDIAAAFSEAMGHIVDVNAVPRDTWESQFRREGMLHPEARLRMLDGFNEGWLDFERGTVEQRQGTTNLKTVLRDLVAKE
ncbi:NmrA family NAD(P)-binding protein (plasmid) [Burkholderia sp. M6-3]